MNLVKKITLFALPAMLMLPLVAGADSTLTEAIGTIQTFISNALIPFVLAVAIRNCLVVDRFESRFVTTLGPYPQRHR